MLSKKEKKNEYNRKYCESEKGRKIKTFINWRAYGIIFHDFELLYEIYLEATQCDFCKCELDTGLYKTKKCLDHDHEITDDENVRGILCWQCNVNDVLNDNKKPRNKYKNNTSGETNISYDKKNNRWIFKIIINKKTFGKSFETLYDAVQFKIDYIQQLAS